MGKCSCGCDGNCNPKSFREFEAIEVENTSEAQRGDTDFYEPPKYLVKPADGDKCYFYVRGEFKKLKKKFKPGVYLQ